MRALIAVILFSSGCSTTRATVNPVSVDGASTRERSREERVKSREVERSDDYPEFAALMKEISVANSSCHFSEILRIIDRPGVASIRTPSTVEWDPFLVFMRGDNCGKLRRRECVEEQLAVYQERWPAGMHLTALRAAAQQFADDDLKRRAQADELGTKLAAIEREAKARRLSEAERLQLEGAVLHVFAQYDQAVDKLREALSVGFREPKEHMKTVSLLVQALERAGRQEEALAVLDAASAHDAEAFQLAGLHHRQLCFPH
jgi:tetratricopeptide (TPR) repeat protein